VNKRYHKAGQREEKAHNSQGFANLGEKISMKHIQTSTASTYYNNNNNNNNYYYYYYY